ncbi:hypothetical protein VTJ04DRAFT_10000 [Mycothermus thermophilus]|uniref:uncharacterized protein n=1 Tax=Humicola insolens TaxID=85995 RepID=UPI003742F6D8
MIEGYIAQYRRLAYKPESRKDYWQVLLLQGITGAGIQPRPAHGDKKQPSCLDRPTIQIQKRKNPSSQRRLLTPTSIADTHLPRVSPKIDSGHPIANKSWGLFCSRE